MAKGGQGRRPWFNWRNFDFLRYVVPPAAVILLLCFTFEAFAGGATNPQAPPSAKPPAKGSFAARYRDAPPWTAPAYQAVDAGAGSTSCRPPGDPPAAKPGAETPADKAAEDRRARLAECPPAPMRPLAVAQGRFDWMAFFMTANAIFVTAIILAWIIMRRNLADCPPALWTTRVGAIVLSAAWMAWSLFRSPSTTDLLIGPTATLALTRYDADFATWAARAVLFNFASGIAATVFVILGGASVLAHRNLAPRRTASLRSGETVQLISPPPAPPGAPPTEPPPNPEHVAWLDAKSGDLKLMIFAGSILVAFLVTYAGFWLKWPLTLVSAETLKAPTPAMIEIASLASGLQLFFGAGYTLILLAFAGPAVVAISNRRIEVGASPPGGASPLGQTVFSASEIAALVSAIGPFIMAMLGTKFGLIGG